MQGILFILVVFNYKKLQQNFCAFNFMFLQYDTK